MSNRIRMNDTYPSIVASDEYYARSAGLIPAHTQTLAKGPTQYVSGVSPKYVDRGKKGHVFDVDGNEFIDLNMGIGPLVLGYSYDRIDEAIRSQLAKGITFSLIHPLEVQVAEMIHDFVPGADMVRFSKSGADVTSAAVRLARAHTGRDRILCCGYHGWHDWYIGTTSRNLGVPKATRELTDTFAYGDLADLEAKLDEGVAAVIMEPVIFQPPPAGYLQEVRRLTRERGAVLIFDEMWTGFRLAMGGAQEYFDVRADLALFSKAVANGMPLSVITGSAELMYRFDEDVFFFTTFGGEALSLAAAKATLQELSERSVPQRLATIGFDIRRGLEKIIEDVGVEYLGVVGMDCRTMVTFDPSAGDPLILKSFVQQEMIRRGVLWSGFHNVCFTHDHDDIDHVLAAYREVIPMLAAAVDSGTVASQLRGRPVQPVFRKTR